MAGPRGRGRAGAAGGGGDGTTGKIIAMISAKNYAAKAEAGLRRWASALDYYELRDIDVFLANKYAELIKSANHFAIPDNGEIFDDELKGLAGLPARIPYPVITVEYFVSKTEARTCERAPIYSPKRLVLVCEIKRIELQEFAPLFNAVSKDFALFNYDGEVFNLYFVMNEVAGIWVPCPLSFIMPAIWDRSIAGSDFKIMDEWVSSDSKKIMLGFPMIALPGVYARIVDRRGSEEALLAAMHDIKGEIRAVLEMLEALTCSNVTTESIQIENKMANEKRIKKGKIPIYETKTLCIETPKISQQTHIVYEDRRSPRQHLRRGHIRKLSSSKQIWVNSCVVGSSELGRIDKNYNISGKPSLMGSGFTTQPKGLAACAS